jgi:sulfate adenylyltransferase subunit 1 (EFTu-like GTPase family)
MKRSIIYVLLTSVLLQSCYSYKTINLKDTPLVAGEKYKIKQEGKFIKTSLIATNDSVANFKSAKEVNQISIDKISEIKIRKISKIRTLILTMSIIIVGAGIMKLSTYKQPNYFSDNGKPIVGS